MAGIDPKRTLGLMPLHLAVMLAHESRTTPVHEADGRPWEKPVISWPVRRTICGIDELAALSPGVTHVLSILDPGFAEPELGVATQFQARLCLRFHDILAPSADLLAPEPHHIDALLAFGRAVPRDDAAHLLVHCHMGVSRSTAAMATLVAQASPETDERTLISHIADLRPQAWPNFRMIALADEQLGRGGRLVEALGHLYAHQISRNPALADQLIQCGRTAELELARRQKVDGWSEVVSHVFA
jgi:predicted protein tyrosine phosphatase